MSFDDDRLGESFQMSEVLKEIDRLQEENEKLRAVVEAARKYVDMYDVSWSCLGVMLSKALEALDE